MRSTQMETSSRDILASIGLKSLALAALLSLGLGATACHTVEGAGRDVQTIGEGVEDTADRTRPYE